MLEHALYGLFIDRKVHRLAEDIFNGYFTYTLLEMKLGAVMQESIF